LNIAWKKELIRRETRLAKTLLKDQQYWQGERKEFGFTNGGTCSEVGKGGENYDRLSNIKIRIDGRGQEKKKNLVVAGGGGGTFFNSRIGKVS